MSMPWLLMPWFLASLSHHDKMVLIQYTLAPFAHHFQRRGESARASFIPGTRACQSNCITVASSLAWRQHRRSCGVFKSWISVAHCPFQWKWRVLHIRYISVLEQVGMSFNGIAYLMKVYLLFKREFPRVLMTWRTARARISNVRSPT